MQSQRSLAMDFVNPAMLRYTPFSIAIVVVLFFRMFLTWIASHWGKAHESDSLIVSGIDALTGYILSAGTIVPRLYMQTSTDQNSLIISLSLCKSQESYSHSCKYDPFNIFIAIFSFIRGIWLLCVRE